MDCKNIIINNQSIALYQKGSGETTLFLIHGNSCSSELFSRQFDSSLAESLFKPSGKIPDFVFDDIRKSDPLARKVIGESIPKGLLRDELKLAEKLNVPLAIFHGEDDQLVNPEYLEQPSITMTWKNKIHYITDAGHSPQWENSDRFNALLEEYAAEVLNC